MVNSKKKLTPDVNKEIKARFAERMKVSRAKVTQWDDDGRLVMEGKFVLVNESINKIKKTAHMNGRANEWIAGKERAEINEKIEQGKSFDDLKDEISKTQLSLDGLNAKILFENARALREKAAALQAAAEHEHYIGQMVKREVIGRAIFDILRALRDNMTNIGRRISVDVAVNTNAVECEKIISNEINEALQHVTKELNARIQ